MKRVPQIKLVYYKAYQWKNPFYQYSWVDLYLRFFFLYIALDKQQSPYGFLYIIKEDALMYPLQESMHIVVPKLFYRLAGRNNIFSSYAVFYTSFFHTNIPLLLNECSEIVPKGTWLECIWLLVQLRIWLGKLACIAASRRFILVALLNAGGG